MCVIAWERARYRLTRCQFINEHFVVVCICSLHFALCPLTAATVTATLAEHQQPQQQQRRVVVQFVAEYFLFSAFVCLCAHTQKQIKLVRPC